MTTKQVIYIINKQLGYRLRVKADDPEEWYKREVEKSRRELIAMAFEREW